MTHALRGRIATAQDYPTFAQLFPELQVPDPLPPEQQFVSRMLPRVTIVEDADGPLGYGFYQVYGKTTHVVHVVSAPATRGRGVGAAIMNELRARALAEGCSRWFLNVKQENAHAIKLYERAGMSIESQGWTLRMPWSSLDSLPGADIQATPYTPDSTEDQELAARFDLDVARLEALRARPQVALLALKDQEGPKAFAAFDPAFPGIYPIRVAKAELAKPIMKELLPLAKHDYVNVWVEENEALRDLLLGAGATLQFSIYRMSAPLR
jgi:ribosomal-protein-alanine N-acetyltransferase